MWSVPRLYKDIPRITESQLRVRSRRFQSREILQAIQNLSIQL
jgi:hypothetical protein